MAGRLIYSAITSLDGYIEDQQGHFEWGEPDQEMFAFLNDMERPVGTDLSYTDVGCTRRWRTGRPRVPVPTSPR